MINISDKTKCSGCYACINICPRNCITMKLDSEGFRYPSIDSTACVECGMCEKACPMQGGADRVREERKGIKAVACYNKLEESLEKSASGGVSHLLAELFIENGGVVFGVCGNLLTKVEHIDITEKNGLRAMQNSKYLQSDVGKCFCEAKKYLEEGKDVFFTGTPCQIAGLYGFLGKDYENLLTADLICHGVPSEKVFKKYIREHEKKVGRKVVSYYRDKKPGWKPVQFTYAYDDGTTLTQTGRADKFNLGFTTNLFQRPSCYSCPFAYMERMGDITLGDWFGGDKQQTLDPENKGLSMIILNSPKGEGFYREIADKMFCKEFSVKEAVGESVHLGRPPHPNFLRRDFFAHFDKMTYDSLFKRYFPKNKAGRLRNAVLRRMGRMKYRNNLGKMFK